IKATFLVRSHPLISVSRLMAARTSPNVSYLNQPVDLVTRRETGHELASVLENSTFQVVGHACVQGAGLVGHDVHVIRFHEPSLPVLTLSNRRVLRYSLRLRLTDREGRRA